MDAPVLFLVFNRMDTALQVFEAIKQAEPLKLYIASDGARASKVGEMEKVAHIRDRLLNSVDWNCEVKTLFREDNLGCKVAVSGAIDWFFRNEKEGIILEDDCLPSQSFFRFCEDMLSEYRNDLRVWHISGDNFQNQKIYNDGDYYFSKIPHIWGWATWSDRWKFYDVKMEGFKKPLEKKAISNFFVDKKQSKYWLNLLESSVKNVDAWDFQWAYTCFLNNGLSINPNKNMVANIGFGSGATHTKVKDKKVSNLKVFDIEFPVRKLKNINPTIEADVYTMRNLFYTRSIIVRIINKISRLVLRSNIL